MANTKISALPTNNNPTGNEELVYAYNNANGKMTLSTMKTFSSSGSQPKLVSWVNIKTINNQSILWSGNLDVSWWGGWGGFEPTELGWDANIWELSEWAYETTYDLYYKTGEAVENYHDHKTLLFVVEESWNKSYFTFCADHSSVPNNTAYAWFWYSASSSDWEYRSLDRWDKSLRRFWYAVNAVWANIIDSLDQYSITQVVKNLLDWTYQLSIWSNPWKWVTYSIYVDSVASGAHYEVTLWTWVTNPFGITLPTNSNKKCLITVLITGDSEWIVTWCTIAS